MAPYIFYILAFLLIGTAMAVILHPSPVYSALSLVVMMGLLAVYFLFLDAHVIGALQIIVYAGAVMVLFLFVIMMQGVEAKDMPLRERFSSGYFMLTTFVTAAFFAIILFLLSKIVLPQAAVPAIQGNVEIVARELFRNYLGPFELTSLLLLVGLFAAVSLAKKDDPA